MKRAATILIASIALVAFAGSAFAALRATQIAVLPTSLQDYINLNDGGINVYTDQEDAQRWASTVSNNSTFTLQIELAGNAPLNFIGLYNASTVGPPPVVPVGKYELFSGAASAGWFSVASFRTGPTRLVVSHFDNNAAFLGSNTYVAPASVTPDRTDFGFYLDGPGGLFFSQDSRNGGNVQMLAYKGTGLNSGSWWMAFEDLPSSGSDLDFNDAVLFCESINPTPVTKTTWGSVKARFR